MTLVQSTAATTVTHEMADPIRKKEKKNYRTFKINTILFIEAWSFCSWVLVAYLTKIEKQIKDSLKHGGYAKLLKRPVLCGKKGAGLKCIEDYKIINGRIMLSTNL